MSILLAVANHGEHSIGGDPPALIRRGPGLSDSESEMDKEEVLRQGPVRAEDGPPLIGEGYDPMSHQFGPQKVCHGRTT